MMARQRFIKQSETIFEDDISSLNETIPGINNEDIDRIKNKIEAAD